MNFGHPLSVICEELLNSRFNGILKIHQSLPDNLIMRVMKNVCYGFERIIKKKRKGKKKWKKAESSQMVTKPRLHVLFLLESLIGMTVNGFCWMSIMSAYHLILHINIIF